MARSPKAHPRIGWFTRRLAVWKRVVWRPTFAVVGAVYAVLAAFAFVRDYVLPAVLSAKDAQDWQGRLAPQLHFHWYWWVIGFLAAALVVVLEGAFRVVRKDQQSFAIERAGYETRLQQLEAVPVHRHLEWSGMACEVGLDPKVPGDGAVRVGVLFKNVSTAMIEYHVERFHVDIAGKSDDCPHARSSDTIGAGQERSYQCFKPLPFNPLPSPQILGKLEIELRYGKVGDLRYKWRAVGEFELSEIAAISGVYTPGLRITEASDEEVNS